MQRVLICDDEPILRASLKSRLHELGFAEIVECADGQAAVATALATFPDLVILDIAMPKKDGITAAREIRQRLKTPIIFLTACYDQETVKKALAVGVGALLTKPLRDQDLWPAIELACAHAEAVERLQEEVDDLKETLESRKVIERAKGVLMRRERLSEPEAFRRLQQLAMAKRTTMRKIAEAILLSEP